MEGCFKRSRQYQWLGYTQGVSLFLFIIPFTALLDTNFNFRGHRFESSNHVHIPSISVFREKRKKEKRGRGHGLLANVQLRPMRYF